MREHDRAFAPGRHVALPQSSVMRPQKRRGGILAPWVSDLILGFEFDVVHGKVVPLTVESSKNKKLTSRNPSAPIRKKVKFLFPILAFLLPFLVLIGIELGLRIVGQGYNTSFWLPLDSENAPGFYRENPRFGWSFFPKTMARAPEPMMLTREKQGSVRLIVFGESAALGDPEPAFGFSRILEVLLETRYQGLDVEIVNTSMTAVNSHALRRIAKDTRPFEADAWIVYAGNNEVVGPYGAGTVFGQELVSASLVSLRLGLLSTRLGQWMVSLLEKSAPAAPSLDWKGMSMFLEQQVLYDDPDLQRVYSNFKTNLKALIRHADVPVLISTVAVNLKDCAPFSSVIQDPAHAHAESDWQKSWATAKSFEKKGDLESAIEGYRRLIKEEPGFAESWFRLGTCLFQQGEPKEAEVAFKKARDLDALRFRADSSINDTVREVASNRPGTVLVDFEAEKPLPGAQWFYEHVHLTFEGNYQLAMLIANALEKALKPDLLKDFSKGQWASVDQCRQALHFTPWHEQRVWKEVRGRLLEPPFTQQAYYNETLSRIDEGIKSFDDQFASTGLEFWLDSGDALLQSKEEQTSPYSGDWRLLQQHAYLLDTAGHEQKAVQVFDRVLKIIPHNALVWFECADLLDRIGESEKAIEYFQQAVDLRPDFVDARNSMALAYLHSGRPADAKIILESILGQRPGYIEARVNLGLVHSKMGETHKAISHFMLALKENPNHLAALINITQSTVALKQWSDALSWARRALEVDPDNATAQYQLAVVYAGLESFEEAILHFEKVLSLQNDHLPARFQYGVLLGKQGDNAAAQKQFQILIEQNPGDLQARMNLAAALAQQGRFRDVIPHLQAILELQPDHPQALRFLEIARAKAKSNP